MFNSRVYFFQLGPYWCQCFGNLNKILAQIQQTVDRVIVNLTELELWHV